MPVRAKENGFTSGGSVPRLERGGSDPAGPLAGRLQTWQLKGVGSSSHFDIDPVVDEQLVELSEMMTVGVGTGTIRS